MENLLSILSSNKQAPYPKSFRVFVIVVEPVKTYTNDKGEERNMLIFGVADVSDYAKAVVYDQTKFDRMAVNRSLVIRNVIVKPSERTIIITRMSRVFPTCYVSVPAELHQRCIELLRPPPAPMQVSLKSNIASPVQTKISIKGKVIQKDATQEVMVKNVRTPVKAIYLQDSTTPKCKISLLRDASNFGVQTGQFRKATNVVINTYKNDVSFSTTSLTELEVIDAPDEQAVVSIEAVRLDNNKIELLVKDGDVICVNIDKLKELLPDEEDIEEYLTSLCVFQIECRLKGTEVLDINFWKEE